MTLTTDASPVDGHEEDGIHRGPSSRPRVLFLGKTYAGWRTRFLNLQEHMRQDPGIDASFRAITGWQEDGWMERMPALPAGVAGRLRAAKEAAPFVRFPRPDVVWTSAPEALLPYLWLQAPLLRRPLVVELDWTLAQQEAMAREYFGRDPRSGAARALAAWRERVLFRMASAIVAWSHWAARSVVAAGADPRRVHVIHPGVDVEWWVPAQDTRTERGPVRLLFVGGDFQRKGGDELLHCFAARLEGRCELDIVTSAGIDAPPGVRVHRLGPNSAELRALYQRANLFVLPTRADCFGYVAIEAMACGVPVLMTDVAGASDIVESGETGWLMPSPRELAPALEVAISSPAKLARMGESARRRVERLFDGAKNDARLAALLIELASET